MRLKLVVIRVRCCTTSIHYRPRRSKAVHTPRNIVCYPEHVWYNGNEDKVVEIELGRVPFRRLGDGPTTVVCLDSNTWHRMVPRRLGVRMGAGLDHRLVGCRRRAGEARINRVEIVEALYIGEDAHGGDIGLWTPGKGRCRDNSGRVADGCWIEGDVRSVTPKPQTASP